MIDHAPTWLLFAIMGMIVVGIIVMWTLIIAGVIGKWSNWPWALLAGGIPLAMSVWRHWRRRHR